MQCAMHNACSEEGVEMAQTGTGVTVVTRKELTKMVSGDTKSSAAMKQALASRGAKKRGR